MTIHDRAITLFGTWARPADFPAKVALALGIAFALAALLGRGRTLLFGLEDHDPEDRRRETVRFLALVGLAAGLLSIAYVSSYLHGGPRIIDATTYFLQGRALAHGHLAWTPFDPSASFRGRFLLYRDAFPGSDASLAGIFPPGYPLLLAFGFMVGAPMVIGPVIAIGLVVATYLLARELAEEACPNLGEPAARAAALLSVFCAAVRYHTADTMSHGASALGITMALACALRARRLRTLPLGADASPFDGGRLEAALAGFAVGYVVATRPVSALPIAVAVAWLVRPAALPSGKRSRLMLLSLVSALPGFLLLLASQRLATGSWLASTQRAYYAIADGPRDCFRYGFGKGIGCVFEHGDFVDARLPGGYGLIPAVGTTLRRLHKHLVDVANFEPLAFLVLLPVVLKKPAGAGGVRVATALVFAQVLAYAPFYFDGDYPGGGARFFADILPIEHALVVLGLAMLASRPPEIEKRERRLVRGAMLLFACALTGFAVHASFEHALLRNREGGRPMFEPDVLANASLKSGLVFVDTDHGFALGHDPSALPAKDVVVARVRNDDRDRMLYEALGRPPSYLYKFDPSVKDAVPTVSPWTPPEPTGLRRFETEAEWPPLAQEAGFAAPVWVHACASGKRALVVMPDAGQRAKVTITVPVPSAGVWAIEVHTADQGRIPHVRDPGTASEREGAVTIGAARWLWKPHDACAALGAKEVELHPPRERMTIEAIGGPVGVDYVSLRKVR